MARFSQALLQGLLNPTYQQGLFEAARGVGQTPGLMMAQREREALEAKKKEQQMAFLQTVNQAQAAAEQGDMNALNMQREGLMQIYNQTSDPKTQAMILDAISGVNAARPAAQKTAQSNKAKSILQTEQALKEMKEDRAVQQDKEARGELVDRVFTGADDRAMQALEQRLAVMKQDAQAVAEAQDIKLTAELTQLANEEKLNEAKTKAGIRDLQSVPYGGEKYKQIASRLKSSGLANAVDKYEQIQIEYEDARLEIQKKRDERKPLSSQEEEYMKERGQLITGDAFTDRKTYLNLLNAENESRRTIALRGLTEVSGPEAKAYARLALKEMQRQPGAEIAGLEPWQDLNDEIDNLSEEQLKEIYDLSEGKTPSEIADVVGQWLQSNFASEFEDMMEEQRQQGEEARNREATINAVIAATNARNQAEGIELLDPNDPAVRAEAAAEADRQAAAQRALKQAQGVGGRAI